MASTTQDLEMEMIQDMYSRLTNSCNSLCLVHDYSQSKRHEFKGQTGTLTIPERMCLDNCIAKYYRVHESMGAKLTELANPKKSR